MVWNPVFLFVMNTEILHKSQPSLRRAYCMKVVTNSMSCHLHYLSNRLNGRGQMHVGVYVDFSRAEPPLPLCARSARHLTAVSDPTRLWNLDYVQF
jgi:hypothetical protein